MYREQKAPNQRKVEQEHPAKKRSAAKRKSGEQTPPTAIPEALLLYPEEMICIFMGNTLMVFS